MPYTPFHDRLPDPSTSSRGTAEGSPTPRYASPDLDPDQPLPRGRSATASAAAAGPAFQPRAAFMPRSSITTGDESSTSSRKRAREEEENGGPSSETEGSASKRAYEPRPSTHNYIEEHSAPSQSRSMPHNRPTEEYEAERNAAFQARRSLPQMTDHLAHGSSNGHAISTRPWRPGAPVCPSVFNTDARDDVVRKIGQFIMEHTYEREDVEVELKLGIITVAGLPGPPWQRVNFPALTEIVLPVHYKVGPFVADMTKSQHKALNKLLNDQVASSNGPSDPLGPLPYPLKYRRIRQTDEFYQVPRAPKVRVSRSEEDWNRGAVTACVRKEKIADLNVAVPGEQLDFRVSVSTESACEMPEGEPNGSRKKDRLCYTHQLVQIDLTGVTQITSGKSTQTFEIEVEVRDVPSLLAEGAKEHRGEPNQFDEMLRSILDTTRILIRNLP